MMSKRADLFNGMEKSVIILDGGLVRDVVDFLLRINGAQGGTRVPHSRVLARHRLQIRHFGQRRLYPKIQKP